jgi:hypothetical protein
MSDKMTSCENQNISSPNRTGNGQIYVSFAESCNIYNQAFTGISQLYTVTGNGLNDMSQSSIINTIIRHVGAPSESGSPVEGQSANFFTTVDFNTGNIGLLFDKAGETPRNSISTDIYTAEIITATADKTTKDFQVQVRILYKQDYISVKRGDVFIINSIYDPENYKFSISAQYQLQPITMIQSRVWNKDHKSQKSLFKSDKSDRSIKTCVSNKPAKRFAEFHDKHYDKYNSRR